jgi:hypothetical protein
MVPGLLLGQQSPVDRLREVLPAEVTARVIAIVTDATSRGLPGDALAERALEARAKGRSEAEIPALVTAYAADLETASLALRTGGRKPDGGEIQSATAAMKMGVDGKTISELAKSAPAGRSLAVPIAAIAALMSRGLPSDAALQAVHARLLAKAADRELLDMPEAAGRMIAAGHRPDDVGRDLGAGHGVSSQVPPGPPATTPQPKGPPEGVPANGGSGGDKVNPGRGKGRG